MRPTPAPRARLGELERSAMEFLWSSPEPVTVREVHEHLDASRPLAYTTVMTVLARMAKKGSVEQLRDGRAFRYRPAISREELTASLMHDALDTVESADRAAALVRFVDAGSADDLAALRTALGDLESRIMRDGPNPDPT